MNCWTKLPPILAAIALIATGCKKQTGIPVGEYASLSGKEAAFGNSSHKGTLLAIEEINNAGGVLGKQLRLITEDTQSKPGESSTGVKKMISRDGVVAVLGEVASGRSMEAGPVCQQNKIPMISPSSTNPKVTEIGDYVFRVCFTDQFQGEVLAKFARETLKVTRVAILSDVTAPYSVGLADYFREAFLKDGGEIIAEQKYSGGEKDFKAQLTAIRANNPEGIFIPGYYNDVGLIVAQARQLGIDVPIFGGDGWEAPELIQIGGAAMEGTYYSTHFFPELEAPEVQNFVSKYKAKFNGEVPDAMAALGYDSALVLADSIKRAGEATPEKIRDAIASTKDFLGATGRTTIDEKRNATKPAVIITVKDGKFKYLQTVNP